MSDPKPVPEICDQGRPVTYERPQLVPLGNLNVLLAASTGSLCDATTNPATGTVLGDCA